MLGIREPLIYGEDTYEDLKNYIVKHCKEKKVDVEIFQSNHEGDLIDKIQEAYDHFDGIVINPAAFTHTSIAIYDALKTVGIPVVEVHISDLDKREDFRKISYIAPACLKVIKGEGFKSYALAIDTLVENYKEQK